MAYSTLHVKQLSSGDTWDANLYPVGYITATGNVALTVQLNQPWLASLKFRQDSTGSRTLTINGSSVTVNTAAGSVSYVKIYNYDGTIDFEGAGLSTSSAAVTPPTLTADDTANTLTASHPSGDSVIYVSINNGTYTAYTAASGYNATTGKIDVGDVARATGYYKFKATIGGVDSAIVDAPAFTSTAAEETLTFESVSSPNGVDTNRKLAQGTNGYLLAGQWTTGYTEVIGLKNPATPGNYSTFKVGFWIDGSLEYANNGGYGAIGGAGALSGKYFRIEKSAANGTTATYKLQTSASGTADWSDVYTYAFNTDIDLYAGYSGNDGKFSTPKGSNFTAA